MSTYRLLVVSKDPYFLPTEAALGSATRRVRDILASAERASLNSLIEVLVSEKPAFHSCLANFESVRCPSCRSCLELGWWQTHLERDFDGTHIMQFSSFTTPCCRATATLTSLIYEMPQTFACFAISCENPGIPTIADNHLAELENILGRPLLLVHAHL